MHLKANRGLLHTQLPSSAHKLLRFQCSQLHVYQMPHAQWCAVCWKMAKWLIKMKLSGLCLHSSRGSPKLGNTCSRGSMGRALSPSYAVIRNSLSDSWVFLKRLEESYRKTFPVSWQNVGVGVLSSWIHRVNRGTFQTSHPLLFVKTIIKLFGTQSLTVTGWRWWIYWLWSAIITTWVTCFIVCWWSCLHLNHFFWVEF